MYFYHSKRESRNYISTRGTQTVIFIFVRASGYIRQCVSRSGFYAEVSYGTRLENGTQTICRLRPHRYAGHGHGRAPSSRRVCCGINDKRCRPLCISRRMRRPQARLAGDGGLPGISHSALSRILLLIPTQYRKEIKKNRGTKSQDPSIHWYPYSFSYYICVSIPSS